jgi:hypothetical protein
MLSTEKLVFDVFALSFFGSEGVEQADNYQSIMFESSERGKVPFEFFNLKLLILVDG